MHNRLRPWTGSGQDGPDWMNKDAIRTYRCCSSVSQIGFERNGAG